MASAKVETWKKKAKSAIDGLGKEFESVAKELAEFDTEMAKKRKAIQIAYRNRPRRSQRRSSSTALRRQTWKR